MRYGSVCSGIEAASVAWKPLGWQAAFLSEIEKFPSAVLAHHHPDVPNRGDMTKYKDWPDDAIDLLVGGTPCQSFSIAGLRQGLADPRGNLMLTYLAIARRYQPRWLVWENVPGVLSSDKGRDFATFVRGLEELGYHAAWRVLDAQFVRVDGYGRAVPQRRRRVFVVGYLGDWRRAAAVLLEPEGMQGDSAPRREKGQDVAGTFKSCAGSGGWSNSVDHAAAGYMLPVSSTGDVAHCLNAGGMGRLRFEVLPTMVAHALRAQSQLSHREDQDTLIATPYTLAIRGRDGEPDLEYRQDGTANAILTPNGGRAGIGVGAICFDTTQITSKANYSNPRPDDPCHPLAAGAHPPAVAWSIMPQNSGKDYKAREVDVAQPIMAGGPVGGNQGGDYIQEAWAVRRLTPTECERLQGFPDGYTNIPWRGQPDGPRYKALGNSMAVNVMRWIGRRIEMVERLSEAEAA